VLLLNGLPHACSRFANSFLVTNSRAIAVEYVVIVLDTLQALVGNLPSMASETKSFLPIRRRHDACIRLVVG